MFNPVDIDLLFAYLLTDTAKRIFEDNCREYGNGLQKFEPNDINKGQMLDLKIIDERSKQRILCLYQQFRLEILNSKEGQEFIDEIDKILVKNYKV